MKNLAAAPGITGNLQRQSAYILPCGTLAARIRTQHLQLKDTPLA